LNREQILVLRDADFFHRYYTSRIGFCANEFLTRIKTKPCSSAVLSKDRRDVSRAMAVRVLRLRGIRSAQDARNTLRSGCADECG
jgi:hypothetical protein